MENEELRISEEERMMANEKYALKYQK